MLFFNMAELEENVELEDGVWVWKIFSVNMEWTVVFLQRVVDGSNNIDEIFGHSQMLMVLNKNGNEIRAWRRIKEKKERHMITIFLS